MSKPGDDTPSAKPRRRWRAASHDVQRSWEAAESRPSDPEGHTRPAPRDAQDDSVPLALTDRAAARAAAGWTTVMFTVSGLGSVLFCVAYVAVPLHRNLGLDLNELLGTGLGVTMCGLSLGMIIMAKTAGPSIKAVQDRPPHPAPPEDERAAEAAVVSGPTELGLAQRPLVRRSLLAALGLLPFPFLFGLRDLGPSLGDRLAITGWKRGTRMVDPDTRALVRLDDLAVGGAATVMPEGFTDTNEPVDAESAVLLMRLPAGVNQPLPGRASWAVDGVVAYSKICTHAGCPVGLFEHDVELLLCPCHQSTFEVRHGCRVKFGPAARPLPQLPIYVDSDGYLRAAAPFDQPVGPSYWQRT